MTVGEGPDITGHQDNEIVTDIRIPSCILKGIKPLEKGLYCPGLCACQDFSEEV